MASHNHLHPDLDTDEQYESADDEDFKIDEGEDDDILSGSSDNEDEDENEGGRAKKRRKISARDATVTATGTATTNDKLSHDTEIELDSGDEATIRKAKENMLRKKKNKKNKKGLSRESGQDDMDSDFDDENDEDGGGEGGFVRTRAMRAKMHEERRPLAKIDGATIDVDSLWAKMNTADSDSGFIKTANETTKEKTDVIAKDTTQLVGEKSKKPPDALPKLPSDDMIKIKRTYKFAGEVIIEEKLVPRDSAEAKLFLSESKGEAVADKEADDESSKKHVVQLRRPLRRFSRFDPNPPGFIKKNWEKQAAAQNDSGSEANGPKLNTVEKSKLDWAAYVDQAGIKDELNTHSKAKEGYLGRMDFLNRIDAKKEEAARNARLRGL